MVASKVSDETRNHTEEKRVFFEAYDMSAGIAERCSKIRSMDVSISANILDLIVARLTDDLLDHGFSHTEIKKAFNSSITEMSQHANQS